MHVLYLRPFLVILLALSGMQVTMSSENAPNPATLNKLISTASSSRRGPALSMALLGAAVLGGGYYLHGKYPSLFRTQTYTETRTTESSEPWTVPGLKQDIKEFFAVEPGDATPTAPQKALESAPEQPAQPWSISRVWSYLNSWPTESSTKSLRTERQISQETKFAPAEKTAAEPEAFASDVAPESQQRPEMETAPTATPDHQTEINNALLLAAKINNYDAVQQALNAGADVNAKSENGITALMYNVLTTKDAGIINLLIQHGADVNTQANDGKTALMFAAEKTMAIPDSERDPIVRTLVEDGHADIAIKDNEGYDAIDYLPQIITRPLVARRKRYLRQENVRQLMAKGLPVEDINVNE